MSTEEISAAPLTKRRASRNRCRMCGIDLVTDAEDRLGVHVRCVHEARFNRIEIPSPEYGTEQSDS